MQIKETNFEFIGGFKTRRATKRVIIHHSASPDVPAATIHQWHLSRKWAGIGYHFVVRADGAIERGRPEQTIGAHAGPKGNSDSIGICLTGNFEIGKPTAAQINSLVWLLRSYLFSKYGELKVIGHKDVMATACPGRNFPWAELERRLKMQQTKVIVNGVECDAVIMDDKTYVEVRKPFEAAGFKVSYNPQTKQTEILKK